MGVPAPDLSVVIVSWNTRALLSECLASILRRPQEVTYEVIVVDNASSDQSAEMVERDFPEVVLVRHPVNAGFAVGSNLGIAKSRGRHVLLLNTDTRVLDDALARLVRYLDRHPDCGAAAAQLVHPDGEIQRACTRFPRLSTALWLDTPLERWFPRSRELARYRMSDWDHADERDVEQPPGNGLALPRRVLDAIGPLDERFFIFYVDVDLCQRLAAAGYRRRFLPDARIVHHLGKSTAQLPTFGLVLQTDRWRWYRKRYGPLGGLYLKAIVVGLALDYLVRRARPFEVRRLRAEAGSVAATLGKLLATRA